MGRQEALTGQKKNGEFRKNEKKKKIRATFLLVLRRIPRGNDIQRLRGFPSWAATPKSRAEDIGYPIRDILEQLTMGDNNHKRSGVASL